MVKKLHRLPYVNYMEVDVSSPAESFFHINQTKTTSFNDSAVNSGLEKELALQEKLNHRMRKEIKLLSEDNSFLKSQIEKMKIFVPVSLFGNNSKSPITNPKSWEMAAKVMKNTTKVRLSEKVKYLEDLVKELIHRNHIFRTDELKLLQRQAEEKENLEQQLDITNAK